jgi:hypothetical protein
MIREDDDFSRYIVKEQINVLQDEAEIFIIQPPNLAYIDIFLSLTEDRPNRASIKPLLEGAARFCNERYVWLHIVDDDTLVRVVPVRLPRCIGHRLGPNCL